MTLHIANWQVAIFPQCTLLRPELQGEILLGLALILAVSTAYLLLSVACARFFKTRGQKIQPVLTGVYGAAAIAAIFRTANYANNLPFAPLYAFFALLLTVFFLILILTASWFSFKEKSSHPPDFQDYILTGTWITLLMFLRFWLPLLLVQIPLVQVEHHLIFIGPLATSICLYLLIGLWFRKYSFSHLALELQGCNLPPLFEKKYQKAVKDIQQTGDCTLHILRPGFRNAMAFYPDNRILVGVDLIEHLDVQELKALLLHELGHLKDRKYIKWVHRVSYAYPLFCVLFMALYQSQLFHGWNDAFLCFILVLGAISFILKKLRVRAEYEADAFVRDHDAALQNFLLSGLHKIYELNGLDKDICQKNHLAHLDPDERQLMLDQGKFTLKRKKVSPFMRNLLIWFVIGLVMVLLYNLGPIYLWPSDTQKWRNLHKAYHNSKYSDQEAARAAIEKALKLSEDSFGTIHQRTYISLNDLTAIHLLTGDIEAADRTSLRAVKVGEQLYPEHSRRVRSLLKRAETLIQMKQWQQAEEIYFQAIALQNQVGDSPDNMSDTLYALGSLYEQQQQYDKAIESYQEIVQLRQHAEEEDQADELLRIYTFLADKQDAFNRSQGATATYRQGLFFMEENFGLQHISTIQLGCAQAEYLQSAESLEESYNSYLQCLDGHKDLGSEYTEDIIIYQLSLAEVCLRLGKTTEAMQYAKQALEQEQQYYGSDSAGSSYPLQLIARIFDSQGDQENARKYEMLSKQLVEKE